MIRLTAIALVWIYASLFYRHRVYGKKHFPKGGGIIASNHSSFLDPPLIGISAPEKIHFLGRETLFHSRFFAWLIRKLNTHPVRRGKGNINAFKTAMELVTSGEKVVIFPEGGRSKDGTLQHGQLGVGMLVQRTGCQVVPAYIDGTYAIWSVKRRFPKLWGKTACVFGTPLHFPSLEEGGDKKEVQAYIVEEIMKKIADLRDWYHAGAKGSPP